MTLEKKISRVFGLEGQEWLKHANPASFWTRFAVLPFLALGIWSRVWLGWYALVPFALILFWIYINPKFFKEPKSTNNWASKTVLGEKVWSERNETKVPNHHEMVIKILTFLQAVGGLFLFFGLYRLSVWPTLMGIVIIYLGKMWFLDRMVWVFEEMKEHPKYKKLLY